MKLPIQLDKRYHLTQEAVDEMRQLRKESWTCQKIADKFQISTATVCYWTNHKSRENKLEKNAIADKTRSRDMKLIAERNKERRKFMKENFPDKYTLGIDYTSAMSEKRSKRYVSKGRTLDELKEEYERQKTDTLQKIF